MWFVTVSAPYTRISFKVSQLDLEDGFDYLFIGDGSDPDAADVIIANLTGSVAPAASFVTSKPAGIIYFRSDDRNTARGFVIEYEALRGVWGVSICVF